jgi:hypothetical protein
MGRMKEFRILYGAYSAFVKYIGSIRVFIVYSSGI